VLAPLLLVVLESVRLEAEVSDGPDICVRLTYRLAAPSAGRMAFSGLEIGGVAIEDVSAFASQTPLPVVLEPRSGPRRAGFVVISEKTEAFELRYVVEGGAALEGEGVRVRLPSIVLDGKLEETKPGLFSSRVALPRGFSVIDGFPSHPIAEADGGYRWELPLVPAFVAFRASARTPLLTPPRAATAAVVSLLLVMVVLGIRKARAHSP
jgi:hypothetical protein